MSTNASSVSKRRTFRTLALWGVSLLGLAGLGTLALRFDGADEQRPRVYVVPPDPEPARVGPEEFRDPAQAELYRAALADGSQRSIALLRQALTQLERQQPPDPKSIAAMREALAGRERQLAALSPR